MGLSMPRRVRSMPPSLASSTVPWRLVASSPYRGSHVDTLSDAGLRGNMHYRAPLKVVGRRCVLFNRPGRAGIQRVAVWDAGLRERSFSIGSRSGSRNSTSRKHQALACGLSEQELCDILYRDITPEDYDMLLRLDEFVPKKTASLGALQGLRPVPRRERNHETCGVCLMPFEDTDDQVVAVPCPAEHEFHRNCISKWLTEYKDACPVDHAKLW